MNNSDWYLDRCFVSEVFSALKIQKRYNTDRHNEAWNGVSVMHTSIQKILRGAG